MDELFDEVSIIVQEADIFSETFKKHFLKSNELIMVSEVIILIKMMLDIKVEIVTKRVKEEIVFFSFLYIYA